MYFSIRAVRIIGMACRQIGSIFKQKAAKAAVSFHRSLVTSRGEALMKIRKLFLALFYAHVMIFAACFSMESKSDNSPGSTPEPTKSPGANNAKTVNKNGDNAINKV